MKQNYSGKSIDYPEPKDPNLRPKGARSIIDKKIFNTLKIPLSIDTSYGEFRLEPIEPQNHTTNFVVTFRFRRPISISSKTLKDVGDLTDYITHECLSLLDEASVRLRYLK